MGLVLKMMTGVIAAVGTRRILLAASTAGAVWAIQAGSAAYLAAAAPKSKCEAYLPAELCTCPHATDDAVLRAADSDREAEDDYLFRNAPTKVSRMRRAEQVRRANGAPSLEEIPFIASPLLAIDSAAMAVTVVVIFLLAVVFVAFIII